jgi:4-hydroxyphenylpyruvate dioxygenase
MTDEKNPLGLKKIHHVEFYVGNAKQAEFYYRKAFGFSRVAYSGLETGNRETTSYVLRQNRVNFVLTTPLNPEHPAAEHIKQHGDGVRDIAFLVEDADAAFNEAVRRGATAFIEPHDWQDENGSVRKAAIHTYGDTIHSFLSYGGNPRVSKGANGNGANGSSENPSAYADGTDFCPDLPNKMLLAKMSALFWLTTLSAMSNSAK